MKNGIIGIVGGMGPDAGIMLSKNIVYNTISEKDQDHLPLILYSTPGEIPDRTEYLTGIVDTNPGISIARILADLEKIGVTVAAIACNSAHAPPIFDLIMSKLQDSKSNIKLLHIIRECGNFITNYYPEFNKVGILGTTGTYKTRQYDLLNDFGLKTVYFSEKEQNALHELIYNPLNGVKSGTYKIPDRSMCILNDSMISLKSLGAEIILLGCTELSLIYTSRRFQNLPVIDSSLVIARALINIHSPDKLKPLLL